VMLVTAGLFLQAASAANCAGRLPWDETGVRGVGIMAGGVQRGFNVYQPQEAFAFSMDQLPVVFLTQGSGNDPNGYFAWAGISKWANQVPFYIVEIIGNNNMLNVDLGLRPTPFWLDDVALAKAALQWVDQHLCIDRQRIYCAGMSRGGRFCCMVASELPGIFAAVAPVSGLRYPDLNRADHLTSIIALHGTADPINPYQGGGPPYWGPDTVPVAAKRWADWGNCKSRLESKYNDGVVITNYTDCIGDSAVVLYSVLGAAHAQAYQENIFGPQSVWLNAMQEIWSFFWQHPLRGNSTERWDAVMIPKLPPIPMPPSAPGVSWNGTALHEFRKVPTRINIPESDDESDKPNRKYEQHITIHKHALPAWLLPSLAGISICACLGASAALGLRKAGHRRQGEEDSSSLILSHGE